MTFADFGVCPLSSFRSFYDDIVIESEQTLYMCISPSFLRLPFDEDLSDSPASPFSFMTNVDC